MSAATDLFHFFKFHVSRGAWWEAVEHYVLGIILRVILIHVVAVAFTACCASTHQPSVNSQQSFCRFNTAKSPHSTTSLQVLSAIEQIGSRQVHDRLTMYLILLTFKGQRRHLVTLGHPGLTYIYNFWHLGHSGFQGWAPECPNVRN